MKNEKNIQKIEDEYIRKLGLLSDASSICDYLLLLGMEHESDPAIQSEEYRIPGCKSVIYCRVKRENSRVFLKMDSDSLLIKGVLQIVEEMYDGCMTEAIEQHPIRFLEHIPEEVIYKEIRDNGLHKCYRKMTENS